MRDVLSKMGRHGLAFAAGLMLVRLVGLIVLPFISPELTTEDFGVADNLALGGSLLMLVAAQAVPSGLFRVYAYTARDAAEKDRAIATAFRYTLVSSAACALLAGVLSQPFSRELAGDVRYFGLFLLVLVTYLLGNLKNVCTQVLRADYRSREFLAVYCVEFLLCAALNLWFVIGLRLGAAGIIYSNLIGSAAAVLLAVRFVPQSIAKAYDRGMAREMVRFAWPLLPPALSLFLMNSIGRFIFVQRFGEEEGLALSGIYGRGLTVAQLLEGVLLMPFVAFWPTVYYEIGRRATATRDLGRCATYYLAVATFLALGLSFVSQPLVSLLIDEKFFEAHRAVPLLAFALLFYGLADVTKVGMMLTGRTRAMTALVFVALAVAAALNLALIPSQRFVGAAIATLGAYATLAVLAGIRSQRLLRVEYEWSRIARIAAVAAAMLVLASALPMARNLTLIERCIELLWRGGLAAIAFPALLALTGFLSARERELIGKAFRDPAGTARRFFSGGGGA